MSKVLQFYDGFKKSLMKSIWYTAGSGIGGNGDGMYCIRADPWDWLIYSIQLCTDFTCCILFNKVVLFLM